MAIINLKLKTYEQLQFEITKLNTDIFLKDKEIERLNNIVNEIEKWLEEDYNKTLMYEIADCPRYYLDTCEKILKGSDKK